MTIDKKTLVAVFAVAIMLGGAFVPLFAGNVSSDTAVDESTYNTEGSDTSLSDIFRALGIVNDAILGEDEEAYGRFMLVPVADPGIEIGEPLKYSQITGELIVKADPDPSKESEIKVCYLGGGNIYEFPNTNHGIIHVKEGGVLALCPLTSTGADGFTIIDNRPGVESADTIRVDNGAYINFMSVWFKVVISQEFETLLRTSTGNTKIVVTNEIDTNDIRTIGLNVKQENTNINAFCQILDTIRFTANKDKFVEDLPDFEISGKFASKDGQLKITNGAIKAQPYFDYWERADEIRPWMACSIDSLTIDYTKWDGKGVPKYTSKVNVSGSIDLLGLYIHSITSIYPIEYIDDITLAVEKLGKNKLSFNISNLVINHTGVYDSKKTMVGLKFSATADDISLFGGMKLSGILLTDEKEPKSDTDNRKWTLYQDIDTFELSFKNVVWVYESEFSDKTFEYTRNLDFNLGFKASKIDVTDREKGVPINLSEISIDIGNFHTDKDTDGKNTNYSMDSMKVNGKLYHPILKYTTNVDLTVTGFTAKDVFKSYADDVLTFNGDAEAKISVLYDGILRSLDVVLTGAKCKLVTNTAKGDSFSIMSDTFKVKNEIPFSKVITSVTGNGLLDLLGQDLIGSLEMPDMRYVNDGGGWYGKTLKFEIKMSEAGPVDSFGLYTDSDFMLGLRTIKDDLGVVAYRTTFKGTSDLNGFVKNIGGEKKTFSLKTNDRNKMEGSMIMPILGYMTMTIDEGTADFSNGGFLPTYLVIGSNAKFIGNDLSAMGFHFACSKNNMSGTVAFNFADGVDLDVRSITFGNEESPSRTINVFRTYGDVDYGGYKITFNVGDFTDGKIVTNKGSKLSDGWSQKGFAKFDVVDDSNANFTIGNKTVNLFLSCIHTEYNLYIDGELIGTYPFMKALEIKDTYDVKSEKALIGWSDGIMKILGKDVSGKVTANFVMPARDVHLESIFAEKVTPKKNVVETDLPAVIIDASKVSKQSDLTVIVEGATIKMAKETVNELFSNHNRVVVSVTKISGSDVDVKNKVIGDNVVFEVDVMVDGEKFTDYSELTSFEVTFKAEFGKDIDGIKSVSYIDEEGHTTEVLVKEVKKLSPKVCEVTVVVNHFSQYMIEPVYSSSSDTDTLVIVLAVVLVLLIVLVLILVAWRLSSKNAPKKTVAKKETKKVSRKTSKKTTAAKKPAKKTSTKKTSSKKR